MKRSNECGCMGCDAEDKGREVCDCGEPICSECMLCPEHHVDHEELARYYKILRYIIWRKVQELTPGIGWP